MSEMPATFTAPTGRVLTYPASLGLCWLVTWRFIIIEPAALLTTDEWERIQVCCSDMSGSLRINAKGLNRHRSLIVDDLAKKYMQLTELDQNEFLRMAPVHERGLLKFVRLAKVDQLLTLTMAAYNLTRLRTLDALRPALG